MLCCVLAKLMSKTVCFRSGSCCQQVVGSVLPTLGVWRASNCEILALICRTTKRKTTQTVEHPASIKERETPCDIVRSTVCQTPSREGNKYTWKTPPKLPHRAGANQTYPPTKAGPKHAAQAHLPAHQTERKSKHRIG